MATAPSSVDEYLAGFSLEQRSALQSIREAIHRGVAAASIPGESEKIRYGMPAVMLGGRYALHFAGWKKHIGLYPVPVFDGELEDEIAPYRREKDTVALSWADPVPVELIERVAAAIVALRAPS